MSVVLHPQEQIIRIFRRYALTFLGSWFLVFLFVTLPFFFMFILFSWGNWGIGLFIASLLLAFFILCRTLFFWRTNYLLVTNQRVIKIERRGILNKVVTDFNFYNIHGVAYKIKGLWQTVFNFGSLNLENQNATIVIFEKIKRPAQVVSLIDSLIGEKNKEVFGLPTILNSLFKLSKSELEQLKNKVDVLIKNIL